MTVKETIEELRNLVVESQLFKNVEDVKIQNYTVMEADTTDDEDEDANSYDFWIDGTIYCAAYGMGSIKITDFIPEINISSPLLMESIQTESVDEAWDFICQCDAKIASRLYTDKELRSDNV